VRGKCKTKKRKKRKRKKEKKRKTLPKNQGLVDGSSDKAPT
jgi:hypothetical protein